MFFHHLGCFNANAPLHELLDIQTRQKKSNLWQFLTDFEVWLHHLRRTLSRLPVLIFLVNLCVGIINQSFTTMKNTILRALTTACCNGTPALDLEEGYMTLLVTPPQ